MSFADWGVVHSNVDTATKVLSSLQAQFVIDKPPELQREVLKRKSELHTLTLYWFLLALTSQECCVDLEIINR